MDEREWWEPVLADAEFVARLRANYPERTSGHSDQWVLNYYAEGRKYAVTWDHIGDAYDQFEKLADAYLALRASSTVEAAETPVIPRCEDKLTLNGVELRCTKPADHRDHERQPVNGDDGR